MPPPPEDQLAQIREAMGRLFERMREFESRLDRMEESQPIPPSEALPPVRPDIVPLAEISPPAESTLPDFKPVEIEPKTGASKAAPRAGKTREQPISEEQPGLKPPPRRLTLEEKVQLLSAMGQLGEEIDPTHPPAEREEQAAEKIFEPLEEHTTEPPTPLIAQAIPVLGPGESPASEASPASASPPVRAAASSLLPEGFLAKLQLKLREKLKGLQWEQLIGAKGAMWAGAIICILAIAYGIQYIFTTFDWPYAKSGSFHAMGLAFLGAGYYLHSKKKAALLGEALAGLGIFTLYAVTFAGKLWFDPPLFGSYGDTVTFLEACIITLAAVAIAVRVPSVIVVLLGALGGYLTPFVIGGDPPNHVLLFSYLAFLNVALISSAVLRKWSFLKPLTFAATAGVFFLWLHDPYFIDNKPNLRWSTEWLVVLHAAIFLLGSTIPPVVWKRKSNQFDLTALSASSLWLMGMTWQLFRGYPHQQLALVGWGLAVLHVGLFVLTYSRVTNVDRMPRIHLALAAIFFTVAIPLQLEDASYLPMAWAFEGAVFAAVGLWFCDRQMYISSLLVFVLSAGYLFLGVMTQPPWIAEGTQLDMRFFIFACSGFMAMVAASLYKWMPPLRERALNAWEHYSSIVLFICGNIVVMVGMLLQWHDSRMVLALWTLDVAIVWAIGFAMRSQLARVYALGLAVIFLGNQLVLHGIADPPGYGLLVNSRFSTLLFAGGLFAVVGWFYSRLKTAARDSHNAALASHDALNLSFEERLLHVPLGVIGHVLLLGAILCEIHSGSLLHITASPERGTFILTACSLATALYAVALLAGGMALRYPLYRMVACVVGVAVLTKTAGIDRVQAGYRVADGWLDIRFLMSEACAVLIGLAAASYLLPALRKRFHFEKAEQQTALVVVGLANMAALVAMTCQWEHRLVLALWAIDVAIVWAIGFRRGSLAARCYGVLLAVVFLGGRLLHDGLADPDPYRIVVNGRFGSLMLVAAVLGVFGWLYSRLARGQQVEKLFDIDLEEQPLHILLGPLAHALALTAIVCEIHSGIVQQVVDFPGRHTLVMCWSTLATALYALALLGGGVALRYSLYRVLAALLAVGVLLKAMSFDYVLPTALWWGEKIDLRFLLGEASAILVALGAAAYLLPALQRRLQPVLAERMAALGLLGAANIAVLQLMTCQWEGRVVLILWTLNAAALWIVGFRKDILALRWYAALLGLLMVGGRMLYDGAAYAEPYRLLVNDRFFSLALVATVYFAAGWNYRRRRLQAAAEGSTARDTQIANLQKQGLEEQHARQLVESEDQFDPLLGILANIVLLVAFMLEIHTWFDVAAAVGRMPFPDMLMAERASYSILWAMYAAGMVVAGFLLRYPLFRYLGLLAFGPILLKVFFVDLAWLDMLPRVLALAVLGMMLLGVAFLYQRFATRILEEPKPAAEPEEDSTPPPEDASSAGSSQRESAEAVDPAAGEEPQEKASDPEE